VADVVFERNAGGLYVRSKGTVTQVLSPAREAARSALKLCADYYRTSMSPAQRARWQSYAARWPDTDRWGNTAVRTGQQAFVAFAFHTALAYGEIIWPDPPTIAPIPHSQASAHIHTNTQLIHILTPLPNWPPPTYDCLWLVYQSAPVNPTVSYCTSPFRFAGTFEWSPPSWPPEIEVTASQAVPAGQTCWIRWLGYTSDPLNISRINLLKCTTTA
jgi:hypothetical protein